MTARTIAAIVLGLFLYLCGCATTLAPGPSYPASLERAGAIDVQAKVRDGAIEFTNTTASPLPAGRLWVNAWYSAPTPSVEVGETIRIPVGALRDEHGEAMRGEGFFATEAPEEVLLAELQAERRLVGLVVVRE